LVEKNRHRETGQKPKKPRPAQCCI
jgi:hypothetical protein